MSRNIRRLTYQCIITDLADFYNVIAYKTMSTLDQLKRRLTLTDSTLSHDQHTDTIYINKYTMNRNARRQFYI